MLQQGELGRLAASARCAVQRTAPAAITASSLRLWGSQAVGEKAEGLNEAAQEAVAATGAGAGGAAAEFGPGCAHSQSMEGTSKTAGAGGDQHPRQVVYPGSRPGQEERSAAEQAADHSAARCNIGASQAKPQRCLPQANTSAGRLGTHFPTMLSSRGLLRPLAAVWAGDARVGGAAWAALPSLRPLSSAAAGTGSAAEGELHHQEEVAEEEAEEWALGQREQHEHEGFEALPWPPPPAGDVPSSRGGSAKHSSGPHNSTNSAGAGPVRCFSGQAGGGGGASGAAGGATSGPGGKMEGDKPPWERAEVLWEAEAPQPGSWRQGGEEKDPFQGEEVNPHSEDHMSPSAREKMLSDEASRIADESGP